MTAGSSSTAKKPKAAGSELIIPVIALLFTLYYFSTIVDSPWTAQVAAFLVGSVLIVLVLIQIARLLAEVRQNRAEWSVASLLEPREMIPLRLGLLAITIAYLVLIDAGGFTLTTAAFLFSAIVLLNRGRRIRLAAMLSLSLSLGGYALFIAAFDTRFPHGPVERFLGQWF